MRRSRWLVAGRVQGVGFRWFVRQSALDLGVRGDVRNLPDGRVEIRATGDAGGLDALLARVRQGPPGARVDDVEKAQPEAGWSPDGFAIRH